jgi:glycosyltransferase involved in cell wall biosynthesis
MEGFGSKKSGNVGDYIEPLLSAWAQYIPWSPLIIYSTKYNYYILSRKLSLLSRLKHVLLESEEQINFLKKKSDLLFCPYGKISPLPPQNRIICQFFEIQDYFFPELFSLKELSIRRNNYRNALAFAEHLIVPSEFVKESICTLFLFPKERVSVAPLPVAPLAKKAIPPYQFNDRDFSFIYYPSNNKIHKNHQRLFLAILELMKDGWKGYLVCSGDREKSGVALEALAQQIGIEKRFIDLAKISVEETSWLYKSAVLMVFPSLFEDYGLPILEGFEAGLPIVCSGVTSLPELGGEAVLYFNPFDAHDIAEKIRLLWVNEAMQSRLSAQGKERGGLFSRKKSINYYYTIFNRVVQEIGIKERNSNKYSLPYLNLEQAEILYRESAHHEIRSHIPTRQHWFNSDDVFHEKNHENFFDIKHVPPVDLTLSREKNLLPIHFFTIVYNGMPFIQRHVNLFKQLPCQWHWHIIEGAAELEGDTSWSLAQGGKLPVQTDVLSNDGTTEYIDQLLQHFPKNITCYRNQRRWHGKLEMISAPLKNLPDDILLWEIDVDEFWTSNQIISLNNHFCNAPDRTAAAFYCRFFVGPKHIADNIGYYGNQEWRRVWRYRRGDFWASHEPPSLLRTFDSQIPQDVMNIYPFSPDEMWWSGLVFDHFAYVNEEQVRFKESYYGYHGAAEAWKKMIASTDHEVFIPPYLRWIKDPIWALYDSTQDALRDFGDPFGFQ